MCSQLPRGRSLHCACAVHGASEVFVGGTGVAGALSGGALPSRSAPAPVGQDRKTAIQIGIQLESRSGDTWKQFYTRGGTEYGEKGHESNGSTFSTKRATAR